MSERVISSEKQENVVAIPNGKAPLPAAKRAVQPRSR